jgi:ADP-ribose pyrophosphatase YjhB (NUDIX family)
MRVIPCNLCVITRKGPKGLEVLLGKGKRNIVRGKWVCPGGKIRKGEGRRDSVIREVQAECGLRLRRLRKVGVIQVYRQDLDTLLIVHTYTSSNFSGKLRSAAEMKPKWFSVDRLPWKNMWPDDKLCLPPIFNGWRVSGEFVLANADAMISASVVITVPRKPAKRTLSGR